MQSDKKNTRLRYLCGNSRLQVCLISIMVGLAILFLICILVGWEKCYADYVDPSIAIGTLLVAIIVWYNEKRENWRTTWTKKLHVIYLLKDKEGWREHMIVVNAPLAGESDIRQWGQSLAQTAIPKIMGRIEFTGFKITPPETDTSQQLKHFGLMIFLSKEIKGIEDGEIYIFDADGSQAALKEQLPDGHVAKSLFPKFLN